MAAKNIGALLVLALSLSACALGERHLGGHYTLVSLDPDNSAIKDQNDTMVIFPNVTFYEKSGVHIYGCRQRSKAIVDTSGQFTTGFGWFLINEKNGRVEQSLSLEQLVQKLPGAAEKARSARCD
ncbi:hypothetical protein [Novosphingobium sp.]|uniref:hypothetical protein n=1 Tax=Novosphingobium sp. TaxID=1874826 RepID=UPI0038BAADD2